MSPGKTKTAHTSSCAVTVPSPTPQAQTGKPGTPLVQRARPRPAGPEETEEGQEARRGAAPASGDPNHPTPPKQAAEEVRWLMPAGGQMIVFGWVLADVFAE